MIDDPGGIVSCLGPKYYSHFFIRTYKSGYRFGHEVTSDFLLMNITVQSSKTIKPDYGSGAAPPTTAVPLTVLDKVNFDQHISDIFFFHPPAPSTAVLEAGLARALAVYREWAGRFGTDANGKRTSIQLNDAGVRFVEATADVALSSVMPLEPTPELLCFHVSGEDVEELMLVQITRFKCESFVIGTSGQHLVSDGRAARSFIVAWGKATRAAAMDDDPVHHDRAGVFVPRNPPRVEFEHRGVEFKRRDEEKHMVNDVVDTGGHDEGVVHRVHFTRQMVTELKSRASPPNNAPRPCSTFQAMAAHLWKCVTEARQLDGDTSTTLKIAVDGRSRIRDPPVPEGYTGNVVLWARPTTTVQDLVTSPLSHIAELISQEVARIDDAYFRSFIDFASSGAVDAEGLVPTADPAKMVHSPDMEVYSQIGIPLYDLDFGTGQPFLYMPSYLPEEGLVFLVPSYSGDGSVDAQVCLFRRDMEVFKNCWNCFADEAEAYLCP